MFVHFVIISAKWIVILLYFRKLIAQTQLVMWFVEVLEILCLIFKLTVVLVVVCSTQISILYYILIIITVLKWFTARWIMVLHLRFAYHRLLEDLLIFMEAFHPFNFLFVFVFCKSSELYDINFISLQVLYYLKVWLLSFIFQKCLMILLALKHIWLKFVCHLNYLIWYEISLHLYILSFNFIFVFFRIAVEISIRHYELVVRMDFDLFEIWHELFALKYVQMCCFGKFPIQIVHILQIRNYRFDQCRIQPLQLQIEAWILFFYDLLYSQRYVVWLDSCNLSEKGYAFCYLIENLVYVDFTEVLI